jgi:hypothetical protein
MLMQKRILATVLALSAASVLILTQTAASKSQTKTYQLGGAWEGQLDGISWVGIHAPLDPNGKRAAIKWQWITPNLELVALMQQVGGSGFSECVGEAVMKTQDTAEYKTVTWIIGPGASGLPELKLKGIMTGTWRYLDENTVESVDTLTFYLPDGTPAGDKQYPAHLHYRVSVD